MTTAEPKDDEPKTPEPQPSSKARKQAVVNSPWTKLENELLYDAPSAVNMQDLLCRVVARGEAAAEDFLAAREQPGAFQCAVNDAYNCNTNRIAQHKPAEGKLRWTASNSGDIDQWHSCCRTALKQILYPNAIWRTVGKALKRFLATRSGIMAGEKCLDEREVQNKERAHVTSLKT